MFEFGLDTAAAALSVDRRGGSTDGAETDKIIECPNFLRLKRIKRNTYNLKDQSFFNIFF